MFIDMDNTLGADLEKGLALLKTVARMQVGSKIAAASAVGGSLRRFSV
jgi:hypothetical protein